MSDLDDRLDLVLELMITGMFGLVLDLEKFQKEKTMPDAYDDLKAQITEIYNTDPRPSWRQGHAQVSAPGNLLFAESHAAGRYRPQLVRAHHGENGLCGNLETLLPLPRRRDMQDRRRLGCPESDRLVVQPY